MNIIHRNVPYLFVLPTVCLKGNVDILKDKIGTGKETVAYSLLINIAISCVQVIDISTTCDEKLMKKYLKIIFHLTLIRIFIKKNHSLIDFLDRSQVNITIILLNTVGESPCKLDWPP